MTGAAASSASAEISSAEERWYATLPRDFVGVIVVAITALIAGLAINHFRQPPLPLAYHTPQERLAEQLAQLVKAPLFPPENVDTMALNEFREVVKGGATLILDAREASFYDAGHVPGALNLSRQDFSQDYIRLRPILERSKDHPIVVYCSGGECHDSRLVASALISLGFTQVKVFTGGWTAWSESGAPIAR
jgi:rhodanese-related sulfurtransferase